MSYAYEVYGTRVLRSTVGGHDVKNVHYEARHDCSSRADAYEIVLSLHRFLLPFVLDPLHLLQSA